MPRLSTDRPTILQIIPNIDTGGAERTVVEMAAAITRAGGRALVATEGGRMEDAVRAAGGVVVVMPVASKNPAKIIANAVSLTKLIRAEGIDLLHVRSRAPAWSTWLAARRAGIPWVTTYHGAYNEKSKLKRAYNGIMARADRVIANSHYTADLIRSRYGTDPARLVVIPRGIDPKAFDPANVSAARIAKLRSAWGVGPDARVVLHAARLTSWKGQGVVIDAAGRLGLAFSGAQPTPVAIILAGDAQGRDGYAKELRARIKAHRLDAVVRLVGHVDDMPAAYVTATATVVPSIEPEAFGRAAIEAQAAGCPVIAARHGAPPETVLAAPAASAGSETGWLVPPNDSDALAGALAEVLALTPELHAALSVRARAHVARDFTLERLQRETLAVYDDLLGTALSDRFRTGAATGP